MPKYVIDIRKERVDRITEEIKASCKSISKILFLEEDVSNIKFVYCPKSDRNCILQFMIETDECKFGQNLLFIFKPYVWINRYSIRAEDLECKQYHSVLELILRIGDICELPKVIKLKKEFRRLSDLYGRLIDLYDKEIRIAKVLDKELHEYLS